MMTQDFTQGFTFEVSRFQSLNQRPQIETVKL
jgi:hypothetical protein